MQFWLCLFLAGGSGVVLRAGLHKFIFNSTPWGTAIINIVGCFLIGFLFVQGQKLLGDYSAIIMVGFLGGFTTYSSYALDIYKLNNTSLMMSLVYFLVSNIVGVSMCVVGLYLAKQLA